MFDRLAEIGQLLTAIAEENVSEQLLVPVETFAAERYQFSEFSVYFYHLLLAVGCAAVGQVQRALDHLFGCLEEIQLLVDEREGRQAAYEVTWEETEEMLDEVKFNIVIVSLLKQVCTAPSRTTSRPATSSRSSSPRPRARNSRRHCSASAGWWAIRRRRERCDLWPRTTARASATASRFCESR